MMNINSINSNNHMIYTSQTDTKSTTSATKNTSSYSDEGVSVRISNEALEKLRINSNAPRDLDASAIKSVLPNREAVAARKAAPLEHTQREEIEVTGVYSEETLAYFVDKQLSGKLEKSNQIAEQMETMIRGAVYNKDATVEQRAIDREAALKVAQHIAENYFENEEEAKSFLDTISKFAENDILREKGYVVLDNSDIAPFKSYTMPNAPANYVRMDYKTLNDIMGGNGTQAEKEDKLNKIKDDVVKRFNDNEKSVGDTIDRIKTAINKINVDGNFGSNLEKLFSAIKPEQANSWNSIMGLLNP